jgi:hypothetical protein
MTYSDNDNTKVLELHNLSPEDTTGKTDLEIAEMLQSQRVKLASEKAFAQRGSIQSHTRDVREYDAYAIMVSRLNVLSRRDHMDAIYTNQLADDGTLYDFAPTADLPHANYEAPNPNPNTFADDWLNRVVELQLFPTRQAASLYCQFWVFKCWFSVIRMVSTTPLGKYEPSTRQLSWSKIIDKCFTSLNIYPSDLFMILSKIDIEDAVDRNDRLITTKLYNTFNWLMVFVLLSRGVINWKRKLYLTLMNNLNPESLAECIWSLLILNFLNTSVKEPDDVVTIGLERAHTRLHSLFITYLQTPLPDKTIWLEIYDSCIAGDINTFDPCKWINLQNHTSVAKKLLCLKQ